MYTEKELVGIAKRENNNKRKYLVVNRLQGKHIPVSPKAAFDMFDELSEIVKKEYKGESLLLVGFAETATAIGARLAVNLNSYYMQTTREQVDNVEYLFFTESHSHATEQKLVKNDIDTIADKVSRIVFVEDEVTTGNTILKIIDIIKKLYPKRFNFSVASLLNGMDDESLKRYSEKNINIHYLVKTSHSTYTAIAESFKGDGEYTEKNIQSLNDNLPTFELNDYLNARRCVNGSEYNTACESLSQQIINSVDFSGVEKILVIGTEEFMYPALFAAYEIEKLGLNVRCHSTTRSPIVVSTEDDYPLSKRYELVSLYDDERKTFIYNLDKYDCILIITDSNNNSDKGLNSLVNALKLNGNENIKLFRWCLR